MQRGIERMSERSKVVSIALGEVGYVEKVSNGSLDLKTANAGTGNWTKYARDLWQAGYYNGNKNGYEWCDVFVDWCFFKAFGKTEGQLMQYQSGPLGAACPYSAGYYKARGKYDREPRVGDQVFYQQDGQLVHTGIVVGVAESTITTVEGNAGNRVVKRTRLRADSYIDGYGHPDYGDGAVPAEPVKAWQSWLGVRPDGDYGPDTRAAAVARALRGLAKMHALRRGDVGEAVQVLQGRLYALGYDPQGLDGSFGPGTETALRAYQRRTDGLEDDGRAGPATMAALFAL